jgi:hypothetical protein
MWHSLIHAPRRVDVGEMEANCTKKECWGLQESYMTGTPTSNPSCSQSELLSMSLVTTPVLLYFSLVVIVMGVMILPIGIQWPLSISARGRSLSLGLKLELVILRSPISLLT